MLLLRSRNWFCLARRLKTLRHGIYLWFLNIFCMCVVGDVFWGAVVDGWTSFLTGILMSSSVLFFSGAHWLKDGGGLHVFGQNMMFFFGCVLKWYILLIVEIHECISLRLVICMAPLHAIIRWSCVVQHSTTASPTCRRCPVSSVHIFIQVPPHTSRRRVVTFILVRENRYYFKMHQLHPQEYVFNCIQLSQ